MARKKKNAPKKLSKKAAKKLLTDNLLTGREASKKTLGLAIRAGHVSGSEVKRLRDAAHIAKNCGEDSETIALAMMGRARAELAKLRAEAAGYESGAVTPEGERGVTVYLAIEAREHIISAGVGALTERVAKVQANRLESRDSLVSDIVAHIVVRDLLGEAKATPRPLAAVA